MTILSYDHIQQRHHEDWTTNIKTIKSLQERNSTETFHDKRRSSLVYMKWYNYDQDIWVTFSWIFSKIRRFISEDEILTKRIRYYQHRNRQSASFLFFINYLKNTSREAHSFYLLSCLRVREKNDFLFSFTHWTWIRDITWTKCFQFKYWHNQMKHRFHDEEKKIRLMSSDYFILIQVQLFFYILKWVMKLLWALIKKSMKPLDTAEE